jgi:hypothetical protein
MPQCNHCGSTNCDPNRVDAENLRQRLLTKSIPVWATYGVWAAAHLVNLDRAAHICNVCGNRF